jgi:hypothetical protein
MNKRISELIELAGTDVSGKWIGRDNAEKLVYLVLRECYARIGSPVVDNRCVNTTFDKGLSDCVKQEIVKDLKEHFSEFTKETV